MARHPSSLEKWNYLVNFWFDTCDAPYSVYIRTLWPALMEAFISYYAVDLTQIFTAYVRPHGALKGRRGGSHGPARPKKYSDGGGDGSNRGAKRTWSKRFRVFIGFDPWDWLGRHLPFIDGHSARSVTPGVITLWHIYELGQQVQYWFMAYEITEQFFYKWASGVAESYYCQEQYRPWCFARSVGGANFGLLPETGQVIDEVLKARFTNYAAGDIISLQGNGSSAVLTAKYLGEDAGPGRVLRLRHSTGLVVDGPDMRETGATYTVSGTATEPGHWVYLTTGPGNWLLADVEFNCVGAQHIYGPGDT